MTKKLFAFFVLFFSLVFCYAEEISFQVLQIDSSSDDVYEQTLIIEDQILEFFFDKGYIVTNEQAVVATKKTSDSIQKRALQFAESGGSKYFICLQLNYNAGSPAKNIVQLSNLKSVNWTAINISTNKKVASGTKKIKVPKTSANNADSVKSFALDMADQIQALVFSK